ncbi:MAG: hypothetical protein N2246_02270 [Candidatus Sumerlaeia bacterium]|nr:hypothetical protein [Candidatus Sumerlaeia bacterium]
MTWYQKILVLDRRWIFLLVFMTTAVFYKVLLPMPVKISPQTRHFYETLEQLKPGDVVEVEVMRNGAPITFSVTMQKR